MLFQTKQFGKINVSVEWSRFSLRLKNEQAISQRWLFSLGGCKKRLFRATRSVILKNATIFAFTKDANRLSKSYQIECCDFKIGHKFQNGDNKNGQNNSKSQRKNTPIKDRSMFPNTEKLELSV